MKASLRVLSFLLSLVVIFTSFASFNAFAEEVENPPEPPADSSTDSTTKAVPKTETTITGITKHTFYSKKSEDVTLKLKISPAKPRRTVRLQLYNSKKKKYKDIKTYTTSYAKTAQLTITIPKKYRKKRTGKWRIVVDENNKYKQYKTKPIKVVTTNCETLELSSKAACIYCLDDKKVLYDKSMNKRLKPMSCTKIMTLICVIESGKFNGTSPVIYASQVCDVPKLNARTGDRYRNKDLCHAMILASANDAAIMVANGTAGSLSAFTRRMNNTAKKAGLKNTHFTNSFGTPDKAHYTTAYDLSKLSAYGYQYDKYKAVVGRRSYAFKSVRYKKQYSCFTADSFVKNKRKGHIGGKTGFSEINGASYSGLYRYKGKVYAVTIINAKTKAIRWDDMKKLYKYVQKHANEKY